MTGVPMLAPLVLCGLLCGAVLSSGVLAQTDRSPRFEVASVKPNRSGDLAIRIDVPAPHRFTATNVPGQMVIGGTPLSQFATVLSQFIQRIVIDRTGLAGPFDLHFSWTPQRLPQGDP